MIAATIRAKPSRTAAVALLGAAALPFSDLTDEHMEHFFFCGSPEAPTAMVGIELCGTSALLRSLVVHPDLRLTGLGKALVGHAEAHARAHGVQFMYLLTTTAAPFFERRGYVAASRDSAPAEIRSTREFADICPSSSAFMFKRL
jgi:amino-acid N-acetyltransferase